MNCIYIWDDQINCTTLRNKITQNDNVKVCMNRGRKCVYLVCHGTYRYPSIIKLIHHDLSFVISFVVSFKQNFTALSNITEFCMKCFLRLYDLRFNTINLFFCSLWNSMTKEIFSKLNFFIILNNLVLDTWKRKIKE